MSDPFHEKLTTLSTQWADDKRDADQAKLDRDQLYAKLFLIYKETSKSVEEAKQRVESSDEYYEMCKIHIEAEHRANLSKRAIVDAETSFEHWRTRQANDRFITRTAT